MSLGFIIFNVIFWSFIIIGIIACFYYCFNKQMFLPHQQQTLPQQPLQSIYIPQQQQQPIQSIYIPQPLYISESHQTEGINF